MSFGTWVLAGLLAAIGEKSAAFKKRNRTTRGWLPVLIRLCRSEWFAGT